jgi:TonB family protein
MKSLCTARVLLVAVCLCLVGAPSSFGWGSKGHKMINKLAAESLPADVPAFLKTPEAINEIEYLGPEPDRWRSRAEPELSAEQAPDHFIDMELADLVAPLPRNRYEYIAALYAAGLTHPKLASQLQPDRVGFQPYITEEVWERLKSAMRDYRTLSAQPGADTRPVEAAILFYAGWLGHYVGDGSQPLHVTVNYDGWVGKDNPNGYTTEHGIHSKFESTFVDAAVNESDVQPLMTPVKTIGDEWDDYLAYLHRTGSLVEKVYQLDLQHGFDGTGTPEGKQFAAERLAAGASMLRDLIYAAWVKSAEPVPDWHDEHASAAPSTDAAQQGVPVNGLPVTNPKDSPNSADSTPIHVAEIHAVRAPFLRYAPDPVYTQEARQARIQGVVLVGLIVDATGAPREIRVIRPLGHGLDEQAVIAVSQYRFTPAQYHGKPVPVEINIEVNFRLAR